MSASHQTPALPAAFQHQPGLRSLLLMPNIPPDHMTIYIKDEAFEPHLQKGEFAVIDLNDREPESGEIFLCALPHPLMAHGYAFGLSQLWRKKMEVHPSGGVYGGRPREGAVTKDMWMAMSHRRPVDGEDFASMVRSGEMAISDGPITTTGVRQRIVGRVVGVFVPKIVGAR